MNILEIIAAVSAYLSLATFVFYGFLSLIICFFIPNDNLFEKFDKYYLSIGTYFCLPLYGFSLIFEGVSEIIEQRNSVLSFTMSGIFFLIMFIIINRKKRKEKKYED